jgi:two-component system, NtrC family, response regulator AtoC
VAAMLADAPLKQSLQLMVLDGAQRQVVDLPASGTMTIGRSRECNVRIQDSSVSRRHALLHLGPQLVIEDLGSANGTMIRDRTGTAAAAETLSMRHLVLGKAELAVGDMLVFGTALVAVRYLPSAEISDLEDWTDDTVGRDPAVRAVYAQAELVAPTLINTLLLGETGVGKEVLARAIHSRSGRGRCPFQAINCAALNDALLESELFGHEKGAFTGAVQTRIGLLEAAAGGTVLLDEVGELSLSTQAKLLRVIEERAVTRLGSSRSRAIDVRFLAATNHDLEADCRTGRFRQDLYFRLNGLTLSLPPLRQRPLDLDHLAGDFLADACHSIARSEVPRISAEAFDCLRTYSWPGNVRELRNAMECAAVLCHGDTILAAHLPAAVSKGGAPALVPGRTGPHGLERAATSGQDGDEWRGQPKDLGTEIRALERARIMEALIESGGVQSEAARLLGISRGTLISRMKEYGLPRPRKRDGWPKS